MEHRNPTSLLTVNRLDVFLKKLYFDVIGNRRKADADLIVASYRKHIILRTGGVEPPDLNNSAHHVVKQGVQDYELEAHRLLQSIETNGFLQEWAIPISNDLLLLNGAHRLAAAISIGLVEVPIVRRQAGAKWGIEWFRSKFSRREFLFLISEYNSYRDCCAPTILWGIAEEHWGAIIESLASRRLLAEKVLEIDLSTNFDGFYLLLHQIYGVALKNNNNIRRKALIHGCYTKRMAVLNVEPMASLDESPSDFFKCLSLAKFYVRGLFDSTIGKDLFLTVHAPDTSAEKRLLQKLLFMPASLRFFKYFRYIDDTFRVAFFSMLEELRLFAAEQKLNLEKICVVGSGVLGACGVRMPADIDIIVAGQVPGGRESSRMSGGIAIEVLSDYSLRTQTLDISADELIENSAYHFSYDGIRFADFNTVYLKKRISGKDKDKRDLQIMRKHVKRCRHGAASRLMRDELLWLESGVRRGFK